MLQDKYGLAENTNCSILKTGINHTYLVDDGDSKYVYRVYTHNWRSDVEILEELALLNTLRENSISVSYPIKDKHGEYLQKLEAPEGIRYAVLFSFAKGKKIRSLDRDMCYRIGGLMAGFHQSTVGQTIDRIAYNSNTMTQLPYAYASAFFSKSLDEMEFVRNAGIYLESMFGQLASHDMRRGIVHLDIWYDNMSIDEQSNVTLFDFDFCGNGWPVFDLGYFALQLFNTEPDKNLFESKLKRFYEGYEAVTQISSEEKALIPEAALATWIFYLGVQAQRFDNWSNLFFTENYLKHFIGLVKNWVKHHNIDL